MVKAMVGSFRRSSERFALPAHFRLELSGLIHQVLVLVSSWELGVVVLACGAIAPPGSVAVAPA